MPKSKSFLQHETGRDISCCKNESAFLDIFKKLLQKTIYIIRPYNSIFKYLMISSQIGEDLQKTLSSLRVLKLLDNNEEIESMN